ncbi:MAG: L-threonylcarbamoyladenylate synthase [Treponema sp.]|nr:L-threonylcarbamoyladenylate synthase [Treponema sp.]
MKNSSLITKLIARCEPGSELLVADCIKGGGVCVLPTDTVYGFSGIVPQSQSRIHSIKGRDEGKPFIQLIAKPEDLYCYTDVVVPQQLFSLWPGAVTVIVPVKQDADKKTTVAFRCPGDSWLRRVIDLVDAPIYSTSVNRSGEPVLGNVEAICQEFSGEVELIVNGDEIIVPNAKPSTLVELLPDGKCKIVRQGSVVIPTELLV